MLSLFKSQEKLIAEIHYEFDEAEERLLRQANNILSESKIETIEGKLIDKAERLSALGFTSAKDVKKYSIIKEKNKKIESLLVKTKQEAEIISYYQQNYPFQKFITEDELERICKKYDLIFAPVSKYIGSVPDKNIKEMESAPKLKPIDCIGKRTIFKAWGKNIRKECPSDIASILRRGFYVDDRWAFDLGDAVKYKFNVKDSSTYIKYGSWDYDKTEIDYDELFIAAPKQDFNLRGLKKKGLGYFQMNITKVKDPIVFRYVRGGIQIITKWGLPESANKELINEKIN